ncbi:MAG: TonB-dependent receptor [Muribaculaceae bacterium]|nr:TonB-dependent receptor [Muribaculaceae bacterium]
MKNICFQLNRKLWAALAMLMLVALPGFAQKITIHGYVDDDLGDPLIGATVMEKGTTNGTATDIDGNFTLNVDPNATLVVSYVGYDPMEVQVNGRTDIKITMQQNAQMLAETVVIGYGSVKKADATGSVAVVKPDEIEAGLSTSAQDLLVGASPGVVVTLDGGNPSGGANITIRGGASLAASNDPLIVVDGVPMNMRTVVGASNPLSLISPENVESMTILKDASATAIYGSRASNGVIIITTKKGQSGRPQVNFTANFYVNTPRNYLDMMDATSFSNFITNRYGADSTQAEALYGANTNWQKEELRTTFSSDYSLSVGGTVKWLPYRVSASYTNNNGIMKHSKMDRVTAGINLTPKFFDDLLSIQANVKGSYVKNQYNAGTMGTAISMNPTLPVKDYENGVADLGYWSVYGGDWRPITKDTWTGNGLDINTTTAPMNPIAALLDNESKGTSWQSIGNLQIDLKMPFLRELRANLNLGYDMAKGSWFGYDYAFSPMAWRNGYSVTGDDGKPMQIRDGGTSATKQHQFRRNLLLDFYLNYNKEFEKIYSQIDITAGYSWQRFHNNGHNRSYVYQVGLPTNDHYLDTQAYPTSYYSDNLQLVSFFGRLNYILRDKYLITATVRWDGTSRFSKDNRWGTFPSVALGWKLLEETFMERTRGWMSELKIRAGYGITGQQDLNDDFFPYLPIYSLGTTDLNHRYPFGTNTNIPYVTPGAYNESIKWEETHTWNAGVDFGFLNNRIAGSIDFYKRTTKDLLTFANYPAGSNLTNKGNINIGDLENLGVEFNINTRPVVTQNVTWTSALNVAWNKNKITRLAEGADNQVGSLGGQNGNIQKHEVGHPAYSFYVYEQVYDEKGIPLDNVFVDRNGDGQIDESDKYLYHSRDPKVTIAWNNNVSFKNWDFGIVLRSNIGNYVFNQNQMNNVFIDGAVNALPLSNLLANNPIYFEEKSVAQMQSDYFVQNASFVRCDNITVGYTWPNLCHDNLRIRLYGAVQNPFVITKYKGLDPEIFSGIDNAVYPKPITFTLGLVATF